MAAARILVELKKDFPGINLSGYFLAGEAMVGEAPVNALAKSPGRKELLGMMAQVINAPGTEMAVVFHALLSKIAYGFSALADKLSSGGDS
jgi:ribosomal protein L10